VTRWYLGAAALLLACGDSKPKGDSTLAAAPDTVKAAVVAAPDSVKPATSAAIKTTSKTGGIRSGEVGRDRAVQPNPIRTLPPRDSTVVGRDSAMIPKGGFKTMKQPKDTHP
jgi:hypothetical protein